MIFFILLNIFLAGCGPKHNNTTAEEETAEVSTGSGSRSRSGSGASTSTGTSMQNSSTATTNTLINKQSQEFPRIIRELKANKKKTSHWIWYVFPTTKPGDSDSSKTYVDMSTVDQVLAGADINSWSEILQEIYNLLKPHGVKPNSNIIPSNDHGRIKYALEFWLNTAKLSTQKYPRLFQAFTKLDEFDWKK